jgi:hypothetical protein
MLSTLTQTTSSSSSSANPGVGLVIAWVVGFGLMYFVPLIIAMVRKHRQTGAIAAVNVLLGWTMIGWVIAFVWACMNPAGSHQTVIVTNQVAPPQPYYYPPQGFDPHQSQYPAPGYQSPGGAVAPPPPPELAE